MGYSIHTRIIVGRRSKLKLRDLQRQAEVRVRQHVYQYARDCPGPCLAIAIISALQEQQTQDQHEVIADDDSVVLSSYRFRSLLFVPMICLRPCSSSCSDGGEASFFFVLVAINLALSDVFAVYNPMVLALAMVSLLLVLLVMAVVNVVVVFPLGIIYGRSSLRLAQP